MTQHITQPNTPPENEFAKIKPDFLFFLEIQKADTGETILEGNYQTLHEMERQIALKLQ